MQKNSVFMKFILGGLLIILSSLPVLSFAQPRDKEEKKEERDEKKAANNDRVDFSVFRRQILTLPEFSEQRKKLAAYRSAGKGIVKIYAVVDSLTDNPDPNLLTGFIQLSHEDNSINVYEVTFNRAAKKIIFVKATGEVLEIEKEAPDGAKAEKAAPKKPGVKPAPKKKKSEDDEEEGEEEEEEEAPAKGKQKNEDD